MRKNIKTTLMIILTATCLLLLAACGGGGGKGGIGSNPSIPSFASSIPESAEAFAEELEINSEFSEVQSESLGNRDFITAKRTIGGKEYEVTAVNYGSETEAAQYFSTMRSAYDAALSIGGEATLKRSLKEEGITNFNWNDTGLSYTMDGYDYFWKVSGSWWIAQVPYEAVDSGFDILDVDML